MEARWRTPLRRAAAAAVVVIAATAAWLVLRPRATIRVGALHSVSGHMAISERALVDALTLATEELNASGGVLGRPVELVTADGASDSARFAVEAERLFDVEGVDAIFGCWTSASRKAVMPVVESRRRLLFYPLQYEGLEQSEWIVYCGAAPNQQVLPATRWAALNLGQRFFLVGSDYVFPRTANELIKDTVQGWRAEVVGERYVPLGSDDVEAVIAEIAGARPVVVLNTLNGATNVAFFRALREAGLTADEVPVVSFSVSEEELSHLEAETIAGHHAAWTYFQSLESSENDDFVWRFRARHGEDRVTSDPIEAAYSAVLLWAAAVERAGTTSPAAVREALRGLSLRAPSGMIHVDAETLHLWKVPRVGRVRADGQFEVVWSSRTPVRPEPFLGTRTREEWQAHLEGLRSAWGGSWEAPR